MEPSVKWVVVKECTCVGYILLSVASLPYRRQVEKLG